LADDDRQREVELHLNLQVITWKGHLDLRRECHVYCHICGPDEALWTVTSVEWFATATFFRLKNVDFSFTVPPDIDTVWLDKGHAASDLLLGNTTKEDTNVVTSLCGRQ
jgi:hypothetical protein